MNVQYFDVEGIMKVELTINKSKDLPRGAIPALEKELLNPDRFFCVDIVITICVTTTASNLQSWRDVMLLAGLSIALWWRLIRIHPENCRLRSFAGGRYVWGLPTQFPNQ